MKTENWLNCHVHAFNYFGGAARLLAPDNCKTATTSNTRYETILNRSYQELAEYYGIAIVPARVRKRCGSVCSSGGNLDYCGAAGYEVFLFEGSQRGGC